MKSTLVVFILCVTAAAQNAPSPSAAPFAEDGKSIDSIIHAMYDVISGPAGAARNWARFHALFFSQATLATVIHKNGEIRCAVMTPDDYVHGATPYFQQHAFYESEVARQTERFGNVAHVFTTYASRRDPKGEPFERGINSVELLYDGSRWWILTISWDSERPDNPIPSEYLKSGASQ
ncbi:MAG TPA: hypothetical protein VKT29_07245 [Terriglobales bacterium]|nr:hypothetical protein [Terriglobales bacterium]